LIYKQKYHIKCGIFVFAHGPRYGYNIL
jgi:hypothetical protein